MGFQVALVAPPAVPVPVAVVFASADVVAVEGEAVAAVVVRPGPALAAAVAVAVALDAAFACPGAASVASDASGQGIAGSALVAWLFCPEGSQTDLPVETLDLDLLTVDLVPLEPRSTE